MMIASRIQNPNLKIKDKAFRKIKLKSRMAAITMILIAETPNINNMKAVSNNVPSSNISSPIKNAKSGGLSFAFLFSITCY
ncbi:MAG: hypothetical protein OQK77_07200 [Psychromonas sp.]|nr:hypothetical protein [Psychromonas sp.]